jgi:radical SAM superfamily enzyme YgiQ (UPF0313 family)
MRQVLFISFDLIRTGEIEKPLAIASLLSYLKKDSELTDKMDFLHLSINSLNHREKTDISNYEQYLAGYNFEKISFIAISAYIWNEYLTNGFIRKLREFGFVGKVILGGYQITYDDKSTLSINYPDAQIFISGYAEQSLKELFLMEEPIDNPLFLNAPVDFAQLPSPYLTQEIQIPVGTSMLRLETKRGCPYRCSFCAHRDLTYNKVFKHPLEKVFEELSLVRERQVKKVNILDPIFNSGKEYLEVMKEINRSNTQTIFTLQSRFENIKGASGSEFLNHCSEGNYHLEFGLQTSDLFESQAINRKNNGDQIESALIELQERNISYEVSLIYGLPGQTLDSFRRSIDFVQSKGCNTVKAFPLMLLRGTELFAQKQKWNITEEVIGDFDIPLVTSSSTFNREEWGKMDEIASSLSAHERI